MLAKRKVYVSVALSSILPALVGVYFLTSPASRALPTRTLVFGLTCFIAVLGLFILRGVLQALVKAYGSLEKLASGEVDAQSACRAPADVSDLARSINMVSQQLRQNMDELQRRAIIIERSHLELARAHANQLQNLSGVVHELRAPLINIEKSSHMLLGQESGSALGEGQLALMKMVNSNACRLLRLISDLLDISKMDAGELSLRFEEVRAEDILHEAFNAVDTWRKTRGLNLEIKIGQGIAPLHSDKDRIVQVIVNLLSNAIKFTPPGGLITLEVRNAAQGGNVEFLVTDSGPGIPPAKRAVLFERFKAVPDSQDHAHPSTGLGLPISKQIVELLGGKLRLEERKGSGTTFVFEIPGDSRAAALPKSPKTAPVAPRKILVVDDEEPIRELLNNALKKEGYAVSLAGDGLEALRQASEGGPFDLVITDVRLPYVDGASCIETMRKSSPRTAFIVVTGFPVQGDLSLLLERGAYPCLQKPFDMGRLLEAVESSLKNPPPAQ